MPHIAKEVGSACAFTPSAPCGCAALPRIKRRAAVGDGQGADSPPRSGFPGRNARTRAHCPNATGPPVLTGLADRGAGTADADTDPCVAGAQEDVSLRVWRLRWSQAPGDGEGGWRSPAFCTRAGLASEARALRKAVLADRGAGLREDAAAGGGVPRGSRGQPRDLHAGLRLTPQVVEAPWGLCGKGAREGTSRPAGEGC